jgi:hypothetical protein
MKKYSFSRKIQLKNYIKSAPSYESAEFTVEGAESKEDAVSSTMTWIGEYIANANSKNEDPFANDECVSEKRRAEIAEEVQIRKDKEYELKNK